METETPKVSDCAKIASIIRGIHALCRILYHKQIVSFGNCHNGVHLTTYTGIVDGDDDLCIWSDSLLYSIFIDV